MRGNAVTVNVSCAVELSGSVTLSLVDEIVAVAPSFNSSPAFVAMMGLSFTLVNVTSIERGPAGVVQSVTVRLATGANSPP